MSAPVTSALAPQRPVAAGSLPTASRITASEIDLSCRDPLLLLFVSGMIWLVLGLLLALISSIKLHAPGLFSNVSWLTFGRVRPAAMNAILYGFASQTGLGVLLWMLCRLGRTRLVFQNTLAMAVGFWNLGVTLGILGILAGDSTGFEWLEMPRYASPVLFVAYALIGICAMAAFYFRRESTLYVSQWYLVAALFWFPWLYSAANLLLIFFPVRGVVQSIVNAWYTSNFLGLWLTPIALAAIFYFIPKLTQRPLYSRPLAAFGFWTLAFFGNWSGSAKLAGGPVPAWIGSVGIAANLLLLVPLIAAAMNWHLTLDGLYGKAKSDLTLRFIVFGAASYIVATFINIVLSLREVSAITHLTYVETAQTQLALFGFVSMTLFGCLNYIVPRVVAEWPSAKMVQAHFWCSAIGIGLVFLALTVGGLLQAFGINNLAVPFADVIRSTVPFIGLATLGQLVLLVGQAALLWNLILLVRRRFEPLCKSVTDLVMPGRQEVRP